MILHDSRHADCITAMLQLEAELSSTREEASGQLHAASLAEAHMRQELDVQRRHGENLAEHLQAKQATCVELQQVCETVRSSFRDPE